MTIQIQVIEAADTTDASLDFSQILREGIYSRGLRGFHG
jgi:hypothetical protein